MYVNLERTVVEEEETYLCHREENADGSKGGLCRCDARDFLGEIQGFDGRIQQRDNAFTILWSLGLFFHGQDLRWLRHSGTA